ncbi:hypothetical protein JOB18_039996 [Solea senegalensis]|uniref:Uncharacterized protein n=1 Tax=Solea senegalensis TaxID=28829 RepID=A0AAV6TAF1_SOLSE|nr:hypothetical protein JOB18_039996 [Solea senegalensis]
MNVTGYRSEMRSGLIISSTKPLTTSTLHLETRRSFGNTGRGSLLIQSNTARGPDQISLPGNSHKSHVHSCYTVNGALTSHGCHFAAQPLPHVGAVSGSLFRENFLSLSNPP